MNIVIIGAGPAGVSAAETVRKHDRQCQIVMLTSEPYPPYSPPALAEYFITGRPVHFWKGEDLPERLQLDYRAANRVLEVQPGEQRLVLDQGRELFYDQLVIASGGRLYAPISGAEKEGIHNFKSLQAGTELLEKVRSKRVSSALIVGAGFIGVEVALLLHELGLEVTMLVRSRVMRGMLDPETSQKVEGILLSRGIELKRGLDADATGFVGERQVEGVQMRSGAVLKADIYVAATGLKPNIEFLEGSGIATNWGILVNEHLRTSFNNVYAAGDVAEARDRITGQHVVYPNYPNAVEQVRIAGSNLLGLDQVYDGAEAMNSMKHLGLPVIAVGSMEGEELRAQHAENLRKLWVKDGRLVGFRLVGDIGCAGIYLSLMRRAEDISTVKDDLLDSNFGMGYLTGLALDSKMGPAGMK